MYKSIILDTDAGSDCDDMMAIAVLCASGIDVKAVTYASCMPDKAAPEAIRATFRILGKKPCDFGEHKYSSYKKDYYSKEVAEAFAADGDRGECETAVKVLRRALARFPGTPICAIGSFTNLAELLESDGDEYSLLNGVELVRESCPEFILMAGDFVNNVNGKPHAEWNICQDIPASKKVFGLCPVPITVIPFELGLNMLTGKRVLDKFGDSHPVSLAFKCFKAFNGRESWDPATALYAVEGLSNSFIRSESGTVKVDENGVTVFEKSEDGRHSVLSVKCLENESEQDAKNRVAFHIDDFVWKLFA